MEQLSTNEHLTIRYEHGTKILICEWQKRQSLQSIQYNGGLILEKLVSSNASKVLNDNSEVEEQWEDAIAWTADYWFPAMEAAGLKHFAWILAKDIFARVSAKRAVAREHNYSVRFFRSYRYAYEWLSQLD